MISHEYKCIFTHIPKTGGKSIKTLFGLPEFERDYKICDHEHKIEYAFGHRNLSEFENEGYFAEYFKFAFVRNPFDKSFRHIFIWKMAVVTRSTGNFARNVWRSTRAISPPS